MWKLKQLCQLPFKPMRLVYPSRSLHTRGVDDVQGCARRGQPFRRRRPHVRRSAAQGSLTRDAAPAPRFERPSASVGITAGFSASLLHPHAPFLGAQEVRLQFHCF